MKYHLAQINIARAKAPLDNPVMADFVKALAEVNALAESSPGFIWRLKDDEGNATQVKAFPDPNLIVNMSVWSDVDALKAYVYRSMHGKFFTRRAEWFDKMESPHLAMWWIPEGSLPTLEEAKRQLQLLEEAGDSEKVFTFRAPARPPS